MPTAAVPTDVLLRALSSLANIIADIVPAIEQTLVQADANVPQAETRSHPSPPSDILPEGRPIARLNPSASRHEICHLWDIDIPVIADSLPHTESTFANDGHTADNAHETDPIPTSIAPSEHEIVPYAPPPPSPLDGSPRTDSSLLFSFERGNTGIDDGDHPSISGGFVCWNCSVYNNIRLTGLPAWQVFCGE